jgi:hypothetical protein
MFIRPSSLIFVALVFIVPAGFGPVRAAEQTSEERELAFSKQMANTVLVGAFTVDGQKPDSAPKEERYEISSVEKTNGKTWIFTARVKYLNFDATLPIPVPVEWAGDTPVVTLTNATLPGLGAGFSCRVIFHDGRYAGTWQHGTFGGHMFGRIEKQKEKAAAGTESSDDDSPTE